MTQNSCKSKSKKKFRKSVRAVVFNPTCVSIYNLSIWLRYMLLACYVTTHLCGCNDGCFTNILCLNTSLPSLAVNSRHYIRGKTSLRRCEHTDNLSPLLWPTLQSSTLANPAEFLIAASVGKPSRPVYRLSTPHSHRTGGS